MGYKILLPDVVSIEVDEAIGWYNQVAPKLANSLVEHLEAAISIIASNPLQFQLLRGGYRKVNLNRFPYKIIFKLHGENIVIVAFAHHKRKQYWKNR